MQDCIFCKIVNKEAPAEILGETDSLVAFNSIDPVADTHILLVPKEHVQSFLEVKRDSDFLKDALELAQKLIKEMDLDGGYRLVLNGGKYQKVGHLHWHLLGGEFKENVLL